MLTNNQIIEELFRKLQSGEVRAINDPKGEERTSVAKLKNHDVWLIYKKTFLEPGFPYVELSLKTIHPKGENILNISSGKGMSFEELDDEGNSLSVRFSNVPYSLKEITALLEVLQSMTNIKTSQTL